MAQTLFVQVAPRPRANVISEYVTVLGTDGNAVHGIRVFERECMACHRVGGRGFDLGPDLTGSPSRDSVALLANILDPNANVAPDSVQYLVIDQNGRTYAGIIASETATSLDVCAGRRACSGHNPSRVIAEMTSTGQSLMPEWIGKSRISKSEMADLVAFLRASHRGGDGDSPGTRQRQSLDIGTLPGLIEPDN